ncbi:MAG: HDOD domain-containing protein [Sedimentisphaerales bacterium]|nr:HDOD domain-containing protein [Sedimentisphaerales bacterium]
MTASSDKSQLLSARDPHDLLRIFETAEDLPTLPEVAIRLQEVVDDPHSSAKDVARIIEDDPAIATKVLKMVNSVFYAPSRGEEITQLQPAIARLGFVTVTNIALSTSIFQAFNKARKPVFDRREFWKHSICVGIVTTVLHDYCINQIDQRITRDMAHLSGIVHDMGKILFERYANTEFHQALENAQKADIPAIKEEARFIGMGHDQAGAWLAEKWKLGPEIQAVIRWHHEPLSCPDEPLQPLIKLVHMADYICHNQQMGESGNPSPSYDQHVREELGLTPDKIGEVMGIVEMETENSDILLSLAE